MPTYLRLIVMLGEIIGFSLFSFFRCKNFYRAYQKDKKEKLSDLRISIVYYSICNSIILFIFLFSFPSYIFLSYSKLILISIAVFTALIPFGLFVTNSLEKHPGISALILLLLLFGGVSSIVSTVYSFCAPQDWIQFKTCIQEENFTETIYPEIILTEDSKIGYSLNDSGEIENYIFFYQDSNGKWYEVDELIEDTIELSENNHSYVEKCTIRYNILNLELDENDNDYSIIEEHVSYKLYYTPNELVEIID